MPSGVAMKPQGETIWCVALPQGTRRSVARIGAIRARLTIDRYMDRGRRRFSDDYDQIAAGRGNRSSPQLRVYIEPLRTADLSWYDQTPKPMIDVPAPTYLDLESFEVAQLIVHVQRPSTYAAPPNLLPKVGGGSVMRSRRNPSITNGKGRPTQGRPLRIRRDKFGYYAIVTFVRVEVCPPER